MGFELAPPPKKPKAKAPAEDFAAYKVAKKIHGLWRCLRPFDRNAMRRD